MKKFELEEKLELSRKNLNPNWFLWSNKIKIKLQVAQCKTV